MGIIGVLISALSIIPNNKGGSLLDELNPAVTTSPSGSDPDSVKTSVVVQYFGVHGWQDLDYNWLYEPYSEVIGDVTYNAYHAPGLEIRLEANTRYKVEFDASNCAGGDNFPMYYDYLEEKWCYVSGSIAMKSGSFTVASNDDGYIKILPVFGELSFISDPSHYEAIQNKMESEGINIRISKVTAAG